MFERVFNKKALAYVLTAAMSTAALPAMAEGLQASKLLHVNPATADKWVKELCPDSNGNPQCEDRVVMTTYSDVQKDQSFARAGYRAASRLHSEGLPILYVMANDNDGDVQTATMRTYVNGKLLQYGVELETKVGLISADTIRRQNTELAMYEEGKAAFRAGFPPTLASR